MARAAGVGPSVLGGAGGARSRHTGRGGLQEWRHDRASAPMGVHPLRQSRWRWGVAERCRGGGARSQKAWGEYCSRATPGRGTTGRGRERRGAEWGGCSVWPLGPKGRAQQVAQGSCPSQAPLRTAAKKRAIEGHERPPRAMVGKRLTEREISIASAEQVLTALVHRLARNSRKTHPGQRAPKCFGRRWKWWWPRFAWMGVLAPARNLGLARPVRLRLSVGP